MSLLVRKVNSLQMRTTFARVPRVNGRAMKHDARTRIRRARAAAARPFAPPPWAASAHPDGPLRHGHAQRLADVPGRLQGRGSREMFSNFDRTLTR